MAKETKDGRLREAYERAKEDLTAGNFHLWLSYTFGLVEGVVALVRPIADRDVSMIEKKLETMIVDQRVDEGVCVNCGGEIKAHQVSGRVYTTSPPDPVEVCVDCGEKA